LEKLAGGDDAVAFLAALLGRGRSSYTLRTYRLGLEHFLSWLGSAGVELDAVDRAVVVAYVTAFARGDRDSVALGRAPATVNHRVSVVASFFGFLIERDRLAGIVARQPTWRDKFSDVGQALRRRTAPAQFGCDVVDEPCRLVRVERGKRAGCCDLVAAG
jgi:hypothetical protein